MHERDLIEFLKIAGRLKRESRRGWVQSANVSNPESVADHSFRLALLSMVLGDLRGLNTEKIMKMALIHDLGESIIGDLTPRDNSKNENKKIEETRAIKTVLEKLPEELQRNYFEIWNEFCSKSTLESKLVSEADKLEMAVQASEYIVEGYSNKLLNKFMSSARSQILDDQMIDLLQLL
jgi:putative hydrolase of HD superfamily